MTENEYKQLVRDNEIKRTKDEIYFKVISTHPYYLIIDTIGEFNGACLIIKRSDILIGYIVRDKPEFTEETFLANYGKKVWVWDGPHKPKERILVGYIPNDNRPYLVIKTTNEENMIYGYYENISLTNPNA